MADGGSFEGHPGASAPGEFAVWLWAERLARLDLLRDLVPDGHPAMSSEEELVGRAEEAMPALPRDVSEGLERAVLARSVAFLRAYGVAKEDLPRRLPRIRADVQRAVSGRLRRSPEAGCGVPGRHAVAGG